MALKQPESMDELVYFTRRKTDKSKIIAWVFREPCPECGKGLMQKPKGSNGKVKVRAKEYVCPECKHEAPANEYEETLTLNIEYTCESCGKDGEAQAPYKRKTFQGVPSYVFECEHCNTKIPITKKMKEPKKKK